MNPTPRLRSISLAAMLMLATVASTALMLGACKDPPSENLDPTITLTPQSSTLDYTVGDTITITVLARDDDGDALTFDYEARTENELSTIETAQWFPTPSMATFTWTPDSADVTAGAPLELIFIVKDSRGGYVDRKVQVNIVPGNGKPQFESSANELYKNCCDKALRFEVKVRDDDSSEVDIKMKESPRGSSFTMVDGKSGEFTWKPDEAQAEQRVHTATFVATDNEDQTAEHRVTIIIPPKNLGGSGVDPVDPMADICAGEQIITHTPLGPQKGESPQFPVEATITADAASRYDQFIIFWSQYDPISNPDTLVYSEEMELDPASNRLTGTIPNQAVREEEDQTIFYKICMIDIEASEQDPTSLICTPTATDLYYSFNLYLDPAATCVDDTLDTISTGNDDFDNAPEISKTSWDGFKVCEANPDFHSVRARPGAKLGVYVSYPFGAALDIKVYNEAQQEITSGIERSDCTGLTSMELDGGDDGELYYVKLGGDEINYHLLSQELESGAGCKDESNEPNDGRSMATTLPLDGSMVGNLEVCPTGDDVDIYKFDLQAGEKVDLNMLFDTANANLFDMTLFSPTDEVDKSSTGSAFTFAYNATEEPLTYEARHCGTHYLLVFSADGSGFGSYRLTGTKSEATMCKDEDMYAAECNHTSNDAVFFSWESTTQNLQLCDKGEDWFKHRGNNADVLIGLSLVEGDASDVTFEALNANGDVLATATKDGNSALILEYTFPDDEIYYFRVKSRSAIIYDLDVVYEVL
jgi:hypothetical protein